MRGKSVILILIALGCGLVASVGISQVISKDPAGPTQVETESVIVSVGEVDVNTPLVEEMVKMEDWPREKIPEGAVRDFSEIQGMFTKTRFYAGELILMSKLSDQNESNAEGIPPGFRVISVTVDAQKGVSGLILPGDRVDVLVFMRQNGEIPLTTTRTVLKDVRVFAVGDKVERDVDENGKVIQAKTVSVLVKPDDVETLHLAANLGTIALTLRRPDEEESPDVVADGATVGELFGEGGSSGPPSLADVGDEPSEKTNESLQDWLNRMKGAATENSTPGPELAEPEKESFSWTMRIHTPGGVETYEWDDPNALPIEGGLGDEEAIPGAFPTQTAPAATGSRETQNSTGPPSLDELAPGTNPQPNPKGMGSGLEKLTPPK